MTSTVATLSGPQNTLAMIITLAVLVVFGLRFGGVEALWDSIDIQVLIKKTTAALRLTDGPSNLVSAAVYAVAFLASAAAALHFDLGATWDALSALRTEMSPTLGVFGDLTFYVFVSLAVLPVILELYGAAVARVDGMVWLRVAILGLSSFDVATDWPRVASTMARYRDSFYLTDPGAGTWVANVVLGAAYNLVFVIWLFLASFGFELLVVLFGWCALGSLVRGLHWVYTAGGQRPAEGRGPGGGGQRGPRGRGSDGAPF